MASEEAVSKCSACGAPLPPGATSCRFCGALLVRAVPLGAGIAPASDAIEALRALVARMKGAVEQQYAYAPLAAVHLVAEKFGARLLTVSNEDLQRDGRALRVNYMHAASPADAQAVYAAIVALVGKTHIVGRKGDVVVEIATGDARDGKAVAEVLRFDEVSRRV
jgi:hypothetical protein